VSTARVCSQQSPEGIPALCLHNIPYSGHSLGRDWLKKCVLKTELHCFAPVIYGVVYQYKFFLRFLRKNYSCGKI
jgi:hypothetical protein